MHYWRNFRHILHCLGICTHLVHYPLVARYPALQGHSPGPYGAGRSSCVVLQRAGRYVVVTACHAKNIPKMVDLQNTPRQGLAAAQRGCGAPNQGWGRYFGRPWRPGSRPNYPQCAPSKSLRILLWASRFSDFGGKIGLVGPSSGASATPRAENAKQRVGP